MPDWMIAIAGVAGIFLIGLIFSAVDLIKDVAKTVFISLFVFIVILLANRYLTPSTTEQSYTNSYPPNSYSFTEPPPPGAPSPGLSSPGLSSPGFSSPGSNDLGSPYSDGSQVAPPTRSTEPSLNGNDLVSRSSEYFNNLVEDIREFVFGSPQYRPSPQPGTTSERDLIYVLPPDPYSQESQPGSIASQPSNPSFNQPAPSQSFQPPAPEQGARSSAGTSTTRPVPAMW